MNKYSQGYMPKQKRKELSPIAATTIILTLSLLAGAAVMGGGLVWTSIVTGGFVVDAQEKQEPQKMCTWGENSDGTCLDLDPCVYSNVTCRAETREKQRVTSIEDKIRAAAYEYGLDPDQAVMIGQCESRLDERASNPTSTAKGIYQFTDGTWTHIKAQGHQYDADENIKQFMIWYPIHPEWWVCE